jgi:hypothetical protein
MGSRPFRLHNGKTGAALAVRVTPRASKNEIVDILKSTPDCSPCGRESQ